ncbi:Hypothetical predicted protein [Mytilus galloprovincialis]|nr:Hypothetical predicted protein [Mytilus galloprovincialis]
MEERDVTNQPRSSQNEFDNQSPCIVTADHLTDTEPEHTCTCPTQEMMSEDELYRHEEDSNNDPTLYSESAYREAIQRLVVTYTMNLKEIYRTRETTTQFIAEQTDLIVQQHLHFVQQKLLHTLRLRHGMTEEGQNIIKEIFNTTDLPFDGLTTSYGRNRYIRNTFNIVEPEIVHVGLEHILKRRHGQEILEVMNASFSYIPMIESIQQFLQNDDIANLVFGRPNFAPNGLLNDFVDGSVFQTHPLLLGNNEALHLSIYFDDLEICNPLGKNAGIHKIGVFYYSILNLPISYRSRLPAIRVLAIIKRKTMSKFGINNVLRRINKDLELLAEGVNMSIKGENKIIKGAAIAFVGDTLASHEFCGFKIGVGFAFQKCRECECTNTDMQTKFHQRFFQQRNLDRYDEQCRELAIATTKGLFRRLSMAYGINSRSCCRDWPYFNLLEMTPEDIMHVVFEGVALYEVKATLKVLVAEDFFSLSQLNNLISSFPYGYKDRECQPSCIPDNVFNSDDTSLRQSASSVIVFLKHLPLMLIEKLNCDRENEYVTFLSQFCEIVKLLMASVISVETVAMLKIMIESHLKKFKDLFPEKTIIPKQHYLVHLLNAIIRYGPLTQVWSMRYEGKHQFIKQRMSGNPNFKNVVKSLSERCVMYEASLNIGEQHSLFSNDLILGKFKAVVNNECKNKIAAFFGTNVDGIKSIYAVNWIIYNGQKFV